jgi:hypothetical protein
MSFSSAVPVPFDEQMADNYTGENRDRHHFTADLPIIGPLPEAFDLLHGIPAGAPN